MKRTRTFATLSAAMVLPFALVACGPAEDADLDPGDAGAPAATPAPETPPAATAPTDMAEMTAPITPIGGSNVAGEVVIDDANDGQATEVTVRLNGSTAGAVHQGHIHTGTCEAPGEVVTPLEPVTIGEDGTGEVTVTANLPTMTAANGSHIVLYHEANASPGAPVACAAIPAHTM